MQPPEVVLINPPYAQRYGSGLVQPMGLAYIAAWLQYLNISVIILDLAAEFPTHDPPPLDAVRRLTSEAIAPFKRVKVIGVGPLVTATLAASATILDTCQKQTQAAIVTGGPLCAVPGFGRVARDYLKVDAYVVGDGERPMGNYCRQVIRGDAVADASGIGYADQPEPQPYREANLDDLPVPARHMFAEQYTMSSRRSTGGTRSTSAFLSRGCPYSCSFCSAPLSSGRKVRRFGRTRIIEEMRSCRGLGYDGIVFYDDCLFVASASLDGRIREFASAIAESGWTGTYQLELRCDAVAKMSEDSLTALRDSGCRQINMGIEKGQRAQLDLMRKRLKPEVAAEACARVRDSGIRAAGTFILGGINETVDDLLATVEFACSLSLDFAQFNPLAVYPGTLLYEQLYPGVKDWLSLCLDPRVAPYGDILWRSEQVPMEVITTVLGVGYRAFYSEERLRQTLENAPATEHSAIRSAYRTLRSKRPQSWDRATQAPVGVAPC